MIDIYICVEDDIEKKGHEDIGLSLNSSSLTIRRAMSGVSIPLDQLEEVLVRVVALRCEFYKLNKAVGKDEHKGP